VTATRQSQLSLRDSSSSLTAASTSWNRGQRQDQQQLAANVSHEAAAMTSEFDRSGKQSDQVLSMTSANCSNEVCPKTLMFVFYNNKCSL
jgi:hypothetical protein